MYPAFPWEELYIPKKFPGAVEVVIVALVDAPVKYRYVLFGFKPVNISRQTYCNRDAVVFPLMEYWGSSNSLPTGINVCAVLFPAYSRKSDKTKREIFWIVFFIGFYFFGSKISLAC